MGVSEILIINNLVVKYGRAVALEDVSISVGNGEFISIIGPNGAGKSTLLLAIAGVLPVASGEIQFNGRRTLGRRPEELVKDGLALVPEGRHIFSSLTVMENLRLGGTTRRGDDLSEDLDRIFSMFPILATYQSTQAGKLSGGEQQMLAIGRALLSSPKVLMLDEPSLGLAPLVVDLVFASLAELKAQGTTILLVEQNAVRAAKIADRTYVLKTGRVALSATRAEMLAKGTLLEEMLGL